MPSHKPLHEAAESLVAVAPLLSRWLERLLAGHEPPLSAAQYEALRAVAAGDLSAAELARRSGVSGPAVSQLLGGLVDAGLLQRGELAGDRRRHALALSAEGTRVLGSADALLTGQLESLLALAAAPRGRRAGQGAAVRRGRPRRDPPAAPSQAAASPQAAARFRAGAASSPAGPGPVSVAPASAGRSPDPRR